MFSLLYYSIALLRKQEEDSMGNCLGAPADDDLSLESFIPDSHDRCRAPSPVRSPSYGGGGGSGPDGGGDGKEQVPATGGGEGSGGGSSAAAVEAKLKVFTLAELKSATRNFEPDTLLGEGGFGPVFKGWVEEKTYAPSRFGVGVPIAVKIPRPDSTQGLGEWQAEVRLVGTFSHPNLVKLLGYCWDDKHLLLIYEYVQNGSLENRLFGKGVEPLSWDLRIKVAIGAARGLVFLHSSEKPVIYRDFKPSNILLDADFNPKLSDYGLAKRRPTDGHSHVTTRRIGTICYAAPESIATCRHLYRVSDVYKFGVVLLELLTGLPVLDQNRTWDYYNPVEWAKPALSEKTKLKKIVDPRLENRFPWNAAVLVAELIVRCLESERMKRPSMEEVLYDLEKINLIKEKPNEARP